MISCARSDENTCGRPKFGAIDGFRSGYLGLEPSARNGKTQAPRET